MKERIIAKDDRIVVASMLVNFFKNGKYIIAECRSLGIITYGKSFEQAKKMFNEAFALWREDVLNSGNLKAVLISLGWKIGKSTIAPKEEIYKVPITLIANRHINIKIPLSKLN